MSFLVTQTPIDTQNANTQNRIQMASSALRLQVLHGSLARRVLFRAFLFVSAITIIPLLQLRDDEPAQLLAVVSGDCAPNDDVVVASSDTHFLPGGQFLKPMSTYVIPFIPSTLSVVSCEENANFTFHLFKELMGHQLLHSGAKVLCVGDGSASAVSALQSLGFSDALAADRHPFFSLARKRLIYGLNFQDHSFDFVFSRALDRVSVPALLVLEIERVLRPGGIGAMLVRVSGSNPSSLIKSATPVSSFLKSSRVIDVRDFDFFTLVVFKKRFDGVNFFENYKLPDECPSIINNKRFMEYLEPLSDEKPVGTGIQEKISFLPHFMDISSRKRLIYIDVGAGDYTNFSTKNLSLPLYPAQSRGFDVYIVHHDTSVLASYVKKPGITFVYYPGLAGNKVTSSPVGHLSPLLDEGFDFLVWFKETVAAEDFVVLKMNAKGVELKLLFDLLKDGAICLVDELFLHCSDSIHDQDDTHGDCMDLFRALRSGGVFVHQW
ncbi:uncharacterized protein LOC122057026 [Macadamia integrifolia]|uniref:uncharacterized protein LOC122057026 n=1 Tax=Macadamia integrifolia TaxID=60698 RepID=UPI001C529369|nr:uncharacterized protein LOC122057026 [Macadamia integrifolia]